MPILKSGDHGHKEAQKAQKTSRDLFVPFVLLCGYGLKPTLSQSQHNSDNSVGPCRLQPPEGRSFHRGRGR